MSAPDTPTNLLPVGAVDAIGAFGGDFADSTAGDSLARTQIEVYPESASAVAIAVIPYDVNIRLIGMDYTTRVAPTRLSYVQWGTANIPGYSITGQATSPARVVEQDGSTYYLLDRNCTISYSDPGLSAIVNLSDTALRLIGMDGVTLVVLTESSYALGDAARVAGYSVTGESSSPAHKVVQDGADYYLLDRNFTRSGGLPVWTTSKEASNTEKVNARFNVVPDNLHLQTNVTYKWRARVYDRGGAVSGWTTLTSFSINNTNPNPPTPSPDDGSFASLVGVLFRGGEFSDPDTGDTLLAYQIQMAPVFGEGYPADFFADVTQIVWDSGKRYVPSGTTSFETKYGGRSCVADTYSVRMRQWDNHDGVSDWAYTTLVLTADFVQAPGSQSSIQIDSQAPWAIRIRAMDANRGPGALVARFEHAKSVGASLFYNAAGEAHFTLPIDDPQVSVVEPKQVHYAIDFYSEDGWRETFAGLVWDYDADQTSVVFTGLDYLALTDRIYDERYDAADVERSCLNGGSKHVEQTIHTIVTEQLTYATGVANSPVGFINIGSIAIMDEVVSIPGTFQPSLQFIVGLLDSHRQGTGKLTRLAVQRNADGSYSYVVTDNPGTVRDNLRLKYGELVNGYRVIPFGLNWASVIHMIGRTVDGVKVMYETASAPGIDQSVWGHIARATVVDNLQDLNDVKRRVKESALQAGKLGQNMGLALRSGVLSPRNGWDVCDVFPVSIVHGVVDTTHFGSGYWACLGFTWEAGDTGEQVLVLSLKPREDETAPDTDLVSAHPISPQREWQIGWGEPEYLAYPGAVNPSRYLDQSTGQVWEQQIDYTPDGYGGITQTITYVPVIDPNAPIVAKGDVLIGGAPSGGLARLPFHANGDFFGAVDGLPAWVSGHVHVWNETPTGDLNGTNATFTLAHTPSPATSLLLFRDGLLMRAGAGNDFTLATNVVTFEVDNEPRADASLVASYTT